MGEFPGFHPMPDDFEQWYTYRPQLPVQLNKIKYHCSGLVGFLYQLLHGVELQQLGIATICWDHPFLTVSRHVCQCHLIIALYRSRGVGDRCILAGFRNIASNFMLLVPTLVRPVTPRNLCMNTQEPLYEVTRNAHERIVFQSHL